MKKSHAIRFAAELGEGAFVFKPFGDQFAGHGHYGVILNGSVVVPPAVDTPDIPTDFVGLDDQVGE